MNELLKALANLPPVKKKIHTVTIQGKTIEVSLEKRLEILKATNGEDGFILDGDKIIPKPVEKKTKRRLPILKKDKTGGHFHNGDPFWLERIAEEGYTWQTESE